MALSRIGSSLVALSDIVYWAYWGLYSRDNGKEAASYYSILGLCRENGKEHRNDSGQSITTGPNLTSNGGPSRRVTQQAI